jgi:hypothetical protein
MIADLANRDFIVFAGAGIPHESKPPITWDKLLAAFKSKEPELVVRDIDEVGEKEYPDYAQEIFEALRGENKEDRYYEILGEVLRATNSRYSSEQRDIIGTACHVVTTNFDNGFKNAMDRELEGSSDGGTTQTLPGLRQIILNDSYSVSYLHGTTDEKCIVFKKDDYDRYYPSQIQNDRGSDNLEQFLRHLYEERTMVFVGVSFNDQYLLKALSSFYEKVKQNDEVGRTSKQSYVSRLDNIQHYAFMPEDMGIKAEKRCREKGNITSEQQTEEERERKREILAGIKIKAVTYHEHVEWTDWLKHIRAGRREPNKILQESR